MILDECRELPRSTESLSEAKRRNGIIHLQFCHLLFSVTNGDDSWERSMWQASFVTHTEFQNNQPDLLWPGHPSWRFLMPCPGATVPHREVCGFQGRPESPTM